MNPDPKPLPADYIGSSHLVQIVSERAVPATTRFTFRTYYVGGGWRPFVELTGPDRGHLLDGTPFVCRDAAACTNLEDGIARNAEVDLDVRVLVRGPPAPRAGFGGGTAAALIGTQALAPPGPRPRDAPSRVTVSRWTKRFS